MRLFILSTLITIIIILFENCINIGTQDQHQFLNLSTDIEFLPYIQEFERYSKIDVSTVPINFDNLTSNTAGICYHRYMYGTINIAYIKIDQSYWKKISQHKKINLIFHEIGHCALNRDHVEWETPNECPSSFMYSFIMTNYCLKKYYKDYLKEMFPKWEGK